MASLIPKGTIVEVCIESHPVDVAKFQESLKQDPAWIRHWAERRQLLILELKAMGCSPVNPCETIEHAVERHIIQEKKHILAQPFEPWTPPAGLDKGLLPKEQS